MGCTSSTPAVQKKHEQFPKSHVTAEKLPAEVVNNTTVKDENNPAASNISKNSSSQASVPTETPPKSKASEIEKTTAAPRAQQPTINTNSALPPLPPSLAEQRANADSNKINSGSNRSLSAIAGQGGSNRSIPPSIVQAVNTSNRSHPSITGQGFSGRLDSIGSDSSQHGIRRLDDYYEVDRTKRIGKGHYASVFIGTSKLTGQRVAVKMIEKRLSKAERLALEVNVMRKAGAHPHIVQLIDVFESDTQLQLVLELVEGGELFEYLVEHGPYSEGTAALHIRDVTKAIAFLHSQSIIHRDLKPENLLLTSKDDSARVKVADFGLAKLMVADVTRTVCGTWAYCAYEVKKPNGSYDNKCDVWSIGVIAFILLSAYHPFDPQGDSSDDDIWERISRCDYNFDDPAWNGVSDSAKDFVSKLLVHDPAKRMSAEEALQHPWLKAVPEEKSPGVEPEVALSPAINDKLAAYQKRSRMNPLQKAALAMRQRISWISSTSNGSGTSSPSSAKRRMVITAAAAAAAARNSARRAGGASDAGSESPSSNKSRSWSMGSGLFNAAGTATVQRNTPSPSTLYQEEKAETPPDKGYISSPLRTAMVVSNQQSIDAEVSPKSDAIDQAEKLGEEAFDHSNIESLDVDNSATLDQSSMVTAEAVPAQESGTATAETLPTYVSQIGQTVAPDAVQAVADDALVDTHPELGLPDEEDDAGTLRSSDLDTVSDEDEDPDTTGDHAADEPSFKTARSEFAY